MRDGRDKPGHRRGKWARLGDYFFGNDKRRFKGWSISGGGASPIFPR
jgi:hypothetical protein